MERNSEQRLQLLQWKYETKKRKKRGNAAKYNG